MQEQHLARYRVEFEKTALMRFTGNLDLHRSLERTLRRAALPLAYTRGFSPHPRLQLASALPLGYTSECELADVWLQDDLGPTQVLEALLRCAPPGLRIRAADRVDLHLPSLQSLVHAAAYEAHIGAEGAAESLACRVASALDSPSLPRERRGKTYDLRPLIESLRLIPHNGNGAILFMRLAAREGATGRPDEVLEALGVDPALARIHRRRIFLKPCETRNA